MAAVVVRVVVAAAGGVGGRDAGGWRGATAAGRWPC
jgi:hypothetical protein